MFPKNIVTKCLYSTLEVIFKSNCRRNIKRVPFGHKGCGIKVRRIYSYPPFLYAVRLENYSIQRRPFFFSFSFLNSMRWIGGREDSNSCPNTTVQHSNPPSLCGSTLYLKYFIPLVLRIESFKNQKKSTQKQFCCQRNDL